MVEGQQKKISCRCSYFKPTAAAATPAAAPVSAAVPAPAAGTGAEPEANSTGGQEPASKKG